MKKILSIVLGFAFILISSVMLFGCAKEYSITVDGQIANGQIELSKAKAKAGEEITVTPTANSGYYLNLASFKANNELIIDYKFIMPEQDVLITAEFLLPGLTSINITNKLETMIETLETDYLNKPNTSGGEVEIISYDAETMDSIFYTTLYPVTENEEYTVLVNGDQIQNRTETISLGNNRFFELELFKKYGARFIFLNTALVRNAEEGILTLHVDEVGYKIYLDFEQYNYLSISQVIDNQEEVDFEEFTISTDFDNDKTLQISLNLYEDPVVDSFVGYSYLILNFDDETTKTVQILSFVTDGVLSLNLRQEILPAGKTLSSIDVYTHIYELGFINYQIEIVL